MRRLFQRTKIREGASPSMLGSRALPDARTTALQYGHAPKCSRGEVPAAQRKQRRRGDAGVYAFLVAVGMMTTVFAIVSYISGRSSMNSSLSSSSHALALQVSTMCSDEVVPSGACVYSNQDGNFLDIPGCGRLASLSGNDGWFCFWDGNADGAPEHVSATLASVVGSDVSLNGVYLSADRDTNSVLVRVGGCFTGRWLPSSLCGQAERLVHL